MRRSSIPALASAAALALTMANAAGAAPLAGDAAAGKAAFGQCAACHAVAPGAQGFGPTLFGVIGRKAGSLPGYAYSPALAQSGLTWTPANLDAFIAAPRKLVAGTKMYFVGQPDPKVRADLIAYLATLK